MKSHLLVLLLTAALIPSAPEAAEKTDAPAVSVLTWNLLFKGGYPRVTLKAMRKNPAGGVRACCNMKSAAQISKAVWIVKHRFSGPARQAGIPEFRISRWTAGKETVTV